MPLHVVKKSSVARSWIFPLFFSFSSVNRFFPNLLPIFFSLIFLILPFRFIVAPPSLRRVRHSSFKFKPYSKDNQSLEIYTTTPNGMILGLVSSYV